MPDSTVFTLAAVGANELRQQDTVPHPSNGDLSMNAKIINGFASAIFSLAFALGYASNSFATTTNGNTGTIDVGTWYNQLMPTSSPYNQWDGSHFGVNNLPLVQTSSGAAFKYQQYDSSNAYVLAQDIAQLCRR
jgi:hypothetical protein